MSELDHLRKKPPDDGGLLLDTKDSRRLKKECQECGVKFYIVPEETSQPEATCLLQMNVGLEGTTENLESRTGC